ncbi:MAG: 2-isopropylmalate synthase, partial [Cyanobacteria bacterium J06598_3]
IWLSTDLRDGNQALIEPMDMGRKLRMFRTLVDIGFKEIEVGFPAASQTEFDFVRHLIEHQLIPDDVTIQVLTPAREALIRRSFEALQGANQAIVHLYNATAPVFRKVVFGLNKPGTIRLATTAAALIKDLASNQPETAWRFQYSPEVFTSTELSFARDICNAVLDVWQPTPEAKAIINLPASVEVSTPNIFADQVEWMHWHLSYRDAVVLCVHPHNDRGCSVAAAELGQMAGAQRVEGCLFGSGERTGNVDLVTLAMNLYTQGISPGLDFSRLDDIVRIAEDCTQLPVHPRHPYAGELVFTAFSGSHQDAIKKGFAVRQPSDPWAVPYLPMDPADVGRSYESVVRVNSQSGKGGIAFLLERDYGITLPRPLQIEFSQVVQKTLDTHGKEISSEIIWDIFKAEYYQPQAPLSCEHHDIQYYDGVLQDTIYPAGKPVSVVAELTHHGYKIMLKGEGSGPIDAFIDGLNVEFSGTSSENSPLVLAGLNQHPLGQIQLRHYEERSLGNRKSVREGGNRS